MSKLRGLVKREGVSARLNKLRGSRRRSIVGLPELVGLAVAGLLLVAALFSYFYLLLPQQSRLNDLQSQRTRLQSELRQTDETLRSGEDTQTSVDKILQSLNDFETRHLVSREQADTAIIAELNSLIRRNSLRLTAAAGFTQFESVAPGATEQQQQRAQQSAGGMRPLQTVFPGVGVSMTVEGTYPNLRRFLRDVESDRRFIVINTVELEGVSDSSAARAAEAAAASGLPGAAGPPGVVGPPGVIGPPSAPTSRATGPVLVSLRLNMAAYFRRPGAPR